MKLSGHIKLLTQATLAWLAFWVAGLPHYYQQYSMVALAVGCALLSVAISLAAVYILMRTRPEWRRARAFWLSLYYTVPFAVLDTLYCGVYLDKGSSYLVSYWYLSLFYVTPWLTFMPTAWLLDGKAVSPAPPGPSLQDRMR